MVEQLHVLTRVNEHASGAYVIGVFSSEEKAREVAALPPHLGGGGKGLRWRRASGVLFATPSRGIRLVIASGHVVDGMCKLLPLADRVPPPAVNPSPPRGVRGCGVSGYSSL